MQRRQEWELGQWRAMLTQVIAFLGALPPPWRGRPVNSHGWGLLFFLSVTLASCSNGSHQCSTFPSGYSSDHISLSKLSVSIKSKSAFINQEKIIRKCANFLGGGTDEENLKFVNAMEGDGNTYLYFHPLFVTDTHILFELDHNGNVLRAYNAYP